MAIFLLKYKKNDNNIEVKNMTKERTEFITRAGLIAAIYVVLTIILGEKSFGPIQVRISEALVLLPLIDKAAVPGVAVGCFLANIFGGYGFIDIVFGSLVTLTAAYFTSKMPNKILGIIPPVVLNAFIVSIWVSKINNWPYGLTALTIGLGEFFAVAGLGTLLLMLVDRIKDYR